MMQKLSGGIAMKKKTKAGRMLFIFVRFLVFVVICTFLIIGGERLYSLWSGVTEYSALHFKEIFDIASYGSLDKEYSKYAWASVFVYSGSVLLFLFNFIYTIKDTICVLTRTCIKCDNFVRCHRRVKVERSY